MVCLGILWNSMQNYLDEVFDDISCYGEIIDYFTMNLGDDYEKFVRDIYSCDSIASWKVDKKIETMFKCTDSRKVTIVFINMEMSKQEYHIFKKRMVYVNLENMKINIREKYSQIVNPYFFDNVFHVSDDENEFNQDYDIVNRYKDEYLVKEEKSKIKKNIKKGNNK